MIESLRAKAALWAGAGVLAVAGVATSLAATGIVSNETPEPSEPAIGLISATQAQVEPESFEALQEEASVPETNGLENGDGTSEALVLGIPDEGSPACENNGCGEVTNAGGVTLHLPQPAVDGINGAAENRAAAGQNGDDDNEQAEVAEESSEGDAAGGVPADSPACENVGCAEVETTGGVTLNLPQPAVDGINRAKENRENAQSNGSGDGNGGDALDDDVLQATSNGGKPDWAGPPGGGGKP